MIAAGRSINQKSTLCLNHKIIRLWIHPLRLMLLVMWLSALSNWPTQRSTPRSRLPPPLCKSSSQCAIAVMNANTSKWSICGREPLLDMLDRSGQCYRLFCVEDVKTVSIVVPASDMKQLSHSWLELSLIWSSTRELDQWFNHRNCWVGASLEPRWRMEGCKLVVASYT